MSNKQIPVTLRLDERVYKELELAEQTRPGVPRTQFLAELISRHHRSIADYLPDDIRKKYLAGTMTPEDQKNGYIRFAMAGCQLGPATDTEKCRQLANTIKLSIKPAEAVL